MFRGIAKVVGGRILQLRKNLARWNIICRQIRVQTPQQLLKIFLKFSQRLIVGVYHLIGNISAAKKRVVDNFQNIVAGEETWVHYF